MFNVNPEPYKDELGRCLMLLAENIVKTFRFQGLEESDMISECVVIVLTKIHRFNPEYGHAFNYCTTVMLNHLRQMYRKQVSEYDRKVRLYEERCTDPTGYRRGRHRE